MTAPDFLDTNVLVYAYDPSEARKQQVAQDLLRRALSGEFLTSTQVLAEFAATLLHKLTPPAQAEAVIAALDALSPIRLLAVDGGAIRRAVEARSAYGVHFYDGLILATAEGAGCTRIWSEDLTPGQKHFGIAVENPFR